MGMGEPGLLYGCPNFNIYHDTKLSSWAGCATWGMKATQIAASIARLRELEVITMVWSLTNRWLMICNSRKYFSLRLLKEAWSSIAGNSADEMVKDGGSRGKEQE